MTVPRTDVDVVIVAHNAGELLDDAVGSAVAQAGAARVWIVDAQSTDGAPARVSSAHPDTHVLAAPNAGFSASNNRGIEQGAAPWVLLLNPDARLEPGALDALVAAGEADPRAGVVGALVLNPDGSAQANQSGRFPTLVRMLGLRVWRAWQRLRGNRTLSPRVPAGVTSTQWVTGACMLVRRAAIAEVGPMDEGFFLYYEDVEWCHRMVDGGWHVLVQPAARCIHHLGKAGASGEAVRRAYRDSLERYTRIYRLPGLRMAGRVSAVMKGETR